MLKRKILVNAVLLSGLSVGIFSSATWAAPVVSTYTDTTAVGVDGGDSCLGTLPIQFPGSQPTLETSTTPQDTWVIKGVVGAGDPSATTAADYFTVVGTPGDLVKVKVSKRGTTKVIPQLNVFDDTCTPISGASGSYEIPASGNLVIGLDPLDPATTQNYSVTLAITETIGVINGKVIDSVSKKGLANAEVQLYSCDSVGVCVPTDDITFTDALGNYEFLSSLPVGSYKVAATAAQHKGNQTGILNLTTEDTKLATLALDPSDISISVVGKCATVPTTGGKCPVAVTLKNNTKAIIKTNLWAIVQADNIDGLGQQTEFSLGTANVTLSPGKTSTTVYTITVPGNVEDTAFIGLHAYVGNAFDIKARDDSFFLFKGGDADPFVVGPNNGVNYFWNFGGFGNGNGNWFH